MSSCTGWHLPREYTVSQNAKKAKKGKIGVKKRSKLTKSGKNDQKWQKDSPSNSLKLTRS
jgi:hypothetical protein